jgi:hypothetical protein
VSETFKVGTRVRGERSGVNGRHPRGEWVEGVVGHSAGTKAHEISLWLDDGTHRYVYRDTARRPADPKPEVRKGDKVRMTYEGVVTKVYASGKPEIDHRYVEGAPDAVQILERAKPDLRPGDVVIRDRGTYLIGERSVHYTSTAGSVVAAGETPGVLAARIARDPDGYTHIKHSDLKGFKA